MISCDLNKVLIETITTLIGVKYSRYLFTGKDTTEREDTRFNIGKKKWVKLYNDIY